MVLTRLNVARLVMASGFLLVCALLTDPEVGVTRVQSRGIVAKIFRFPPAPPKPVLVPKIEDSPRDRLPQRLPMLAMHWETVAPAHLETLDYVRREAGEDLSPLDFEPLTNLGPLGSWLGTEPWGLPAWFRATVKSYTTPVGADTDINLFFHWDDWKVLFALRNQTTMSGFALTGYFPGFTTELYEFPLFLSRQPVLVTPRVSVWSQPVVRSLGFQNDSWGVLGSLTVEVPLQPNLWLWLEGKGKTSGWVDDSVNNGSLMEFKTGLHWSL